MKNAFKALKKLSSWGQNVGGPKKSIAPGEKFYKNFDTSEIPDKEADQKMFVSSKKQNLEKIMAFASKIL